VTAARQRTHCRGGYERIGDGEHSEVFRRPGSRYCVQLFKIGCAELTVAKIRGEYAYLRQVYAELPGLITAQRLFADNPRVPVWQTLLVKEWVNVDHHRPLNRVRRPDLRPATVEQLASFIEVTRGLLAQPPWVQTLLPDIIDDRFQNLALDTHGNLRLLDTNRLINTNALRQLAPGQTLDITRRRIHATFLRRLMYLDAAFRDQSTDRLRQDAVYSQYLCAEDFEILFQESAALGEPI